MANTELMGTGHWNAYLSLIKILFGSDIHKISPDDFHVDNNGLVTLRVVHEDDLVQYQLQPAEKLVD